MMNENLPASRAGGRRWISEEIASLDPVVDSTRIVLLSANRLLPRRGGALILNLLYSTGFLRICGQVEGARAVDREGRGKIHRNGDGRADDTIAHFTTWIRYGPRSAEGAASLRQVRQIHDSYAKRYSMSNETMVHTIALFTLQFEHLFRLVGAPGYSEIEKRALVNDWRVIAGRLGVEDVPATWDGMERFLGWFEASPVWFGPTAEGHRCAESLIEQFSRRWLPPGCRWIGRLLLLSLVEDNVLLATGERKPPRRVVGALRLLIRMELVATQRFCRERRQLLDPTTLLDPRPA
jgi:hypothetical protein